MELPVVYPEGASSAELTVTGIGFSRKYEGITGCMPWDWILMC